MGSTKELLEDMHYLYDRMLKRIEIAEHEYYYKLNNKGNGNKSN